MNFFKIDINKQTIGVRKSMTNITNTYKFFDKFNKFFIIEM